jgi:two-component system cell cycle sensor histidine kinase/response regulator CckA
LQTGLSRAERFHPTYLQRAYSSRWPLVTAIMLTGAAVIAFAASERLARGPHVQPWNEVLRGSLLLMAVAIGSAVPFAIATWRSNQLRKDELARAKAELQAQAATVLDTDERFRLMFEGNPLPTYVYDCASLRLVELNQAAAEKYGYIRDEFLKLSVTDIRPETEPAKLLLELKGRHVGFNNAGVWQQRRKDGSVFSAEATVMRFEEEGCVQELVLATDVTQKLEAEEALRESKARLRSLVDRAPFGIFRSSLAGDCFESVNPAFCRMLGYSETELQRMSLSKDLYAPSRNRRELVDLLRRDGRLEAQEVNLQRKDGSELRVRLTAYLTPAGDGTAEQVEAYIEDLTEQGALEQQIRAVQKLEAVGRLAGGVAHDFNNILVVIKLATEMMLSRVTPDSPLSKPLLQVSNASDRAAALTKQMLAFSRRQMMEMRVVNINAVVRDTSQMLRRIIGEDIRLVTKMADDLANTKLDPDQLSQVVMNLAVNARDAMPTGGTLQIETANVELDAAYAETHPPVQPGRYVMLAVSDTGTGISKANLPRVFDPFFTTKEVGKGTGLGLSIVYGIVKQSGGYVWVYSEPGQGARFELYFRITGSPVDRPSQRVDTTGHVIGQTILVVEDDSAIRGNVRDCLHQMGYNILEADSGEAALDRCEEKRGMIDLIMTDLVMPGMGGLKMAKQLATRFPGVRILFTSGYAEDSIACQEFLQEGDSFLEKPFSVTELSRAVYRLLTAKPAKTPANHEEEMTASAR